MAMSLPFFLVAGLTQRQRATVALGPYLKKHSWRIIGLGLSGYYVASLLDFWALIHLPAGLARLILFTYPTLVLLLSALFLQRPISRMEMGALALSYAGVLLAFSDQLTGDWTDGYAWGILLSFGSALAYAVYLIGSGEYLPKLGTRTYTSLTMSIACIAILIHHAIVNRTGLFHYPTPVYWLTAGMALLATVIPSFMVAEGIRRLGASQSSIISSFGPISTILLAYLFLGERLGFWQWIGALLVIGGVWVISQQQRKRR
jgi:drug/metabolite transporter (DMT)-like permease